MLHLNSGTRKFSDKVEGKMGHDDFVYFIVSEEDKPFEPRLEYWYLFPINYPSHLLVLFCERSHKISCCTVANMRVV